MAAMTNTTSASAQLSRVIRAKSTTARPRRVAVRIFGTFQTRGGGVVTVVVDATDIKPTREIGQAYQHYWEVP